MKVAFVKLKERQDDIDVNDIDLADNTLSAFMSDGKAYREVTPEIIGKISNGHLVITEFHIEPLGNVIYLEAAPQFN